MAELLADLQAQLIALNAARAKGVRSISYSGGGGVTRTVEYRSDIEMQGAQNDLLRRISALQGNTSRTVRISSSKSLDNDESDSFANNER